MNTRTRVVILLTLSLMIAIGCDTETKQPGPLMRAAQQDRTLTSALPSQSPSAPGLIEGAMPPPQVPSKPGLPDSVPDDALREATADDTASENDVGSWAPVLDGDGQVTLRRLVTASGVERREPLGASALFALGEPRVYAFIEAENLAEEDESVTVFFIAPSGKATGGIELTIPAGSPRWRTWAFTRFADELGLWRVEVRSSTGDLLGALPFEIAPGC